MKKRVLSVMLAVIFVIGFSAPAAVSAYRYIPGIITQQRWDTERAEMFFTPMSLMRMIGGEEPALQWQAHSRRKNTYFGSNTSDMLDYFGISNEDYLSCYARSPESRIKNIQWVMENRNAKADGTGASLDYLYEGIYGEYYIYTIPYPVIYEIGVEEFDRWRDALVELDPSEQKVNLPKLLNDFSITDEHFRELIAENQLEYFFTEERVEDVLRQRAWADEIRVGENNPNTGAC